MAGKSKQKIIFVITKSVWGGAQKYVYDIATNLPKDLFETRVACGGRGPLVLKLEDAGVPCSNIYNFQKSVNVLKEVLAYFEILRLFLRERPDIIHTNSSKAAGIAGAAGWNYKLLTWNFRVKLIFTAHGWGFHENRPSWQIFLIKLFSFMTAVYYKKIICVSEHDRQSAIKNHITRAKKLVTIHNGIDRGDYIFLPKETSRQMLRPASGDDIWVGTVGEFTKNKGHKYLIESAKGLNAKIFVIGYGEDKKNLLKKIAELKLEDKVFLISNLPSPANYLKAFDVFVLPSLKEGFPYVLLEAGLAGLPAVATDTGGIPELVQSDSLVKPGDTEGLKKALEKFINDPELRKKSAEALQEKVKSEFGFEKMLKLTLSIYNGDKKATP